MTEVYYVPGAENYYDSNEDVVVLDANLNDFPLAKEYILQHELQHAENGDVFWKNLLHELETDIEFYVGSSEEIREVREYFSKTREGGSLNCVLVNMFRDLWNVPLRPIGRVYQLVI